MKTADQLADIDKDAEDVLVRMMDDRSAETSRCLYGHSGAVYSLTFSPDRNLLLSCSEDSTSKLFIIIVWLLVILCRHK